VVGLVADIMQRRRKKSAAPEDTPRGEPREARP
jgi:hypothetical protein